MSEEQAGNPLADYRLFFLFNDGKEVRAYSSNVPTLNEDHVPLRLEGPYELGSERTGELVSHVAAEPVYDTQALRVIYATNTKHHDTKGREFSLGIPPVKDKIKGGLDDDPKHEQFLVDEYYEFRSAISVWTIGRHAAVEKVEHTKLRGAYFESQPSVLLAGGTISTGVMGHNSRWDVPEYLLGLKQDNGQYMESSMNDGVADFIGKKSKTFAGTLPTMSYVYNITSQSDDTPCWYEIRTMKTSEYKNHGKETGLKWQTSLFYPRFETEALPAHVFSEDTIAKSPRLLLFGWRKDSRAIMACSLPLRADGSLKRRDGNQVPIKSEVLIDLDKPEPGPHRVGWPPSRTHVNENGEEVPIKQPGPRISKTGVNKLKALQFANGQWKITAEGDPTFNKTIGFGQSLEVDKGGNRNLNAFVFGKQLVLLWATSQGLGGVKGDLEDDGTVPKNWKWYTVKVVMKNKLPDDPTEYSFQGVTVHKDFL